MFWNKPYFYCARLGKKIHRFAFLTLKLSQDRAKIDCYPIEPLLCNNLPAVGLEVLLEHVAKRRANPTR